ncbi:MAG: DNA polymerase III subunit delta', partial [Stenotrophomonas nitritireducens]|nr:DNA polymerase III subunit delta' [Stenotrophomonas nitritireducens]
LADRWLQGEGMALRRQVAEELDKLAGGRVGAVELAQRWSGDEHADLRLRHAADLALRRATDGLTDPGRLHKLAAWFDAANRTRDLLRTTVRADLAMVELLLGWAAANPPPSKGNNR